MSEPLNAGKKLTLGVQQCRFTQSCPAGRPSQGYCTNVRRKSKMDGCFPINIYQKVSRFHKCLPVMKCCPQRRFIDTTMWKNMMIHW